MASKTITNSAEELFPQNRLRKSLVVQNEDDTINVFFKQEKPGTTSASATDHDHRIGPGGAIALNFNNDGEEAIKERWTIVAASGTPRISFFETESVDR